MIDGRGRQIDHLRISLTDHCNLACRYCVPDEHQQRTHFIDTAFAYEVIRWLAQNHGIGHVRLTGGEPLLHPELVPLVARLSGLAELREITLTTNAQALARQAAPLRAAGLARINISLDTLNPERFAEITRGGKLAHSLVGIEAALHAGLSPVRINMVTQRGLNETELCDLAEWGLARGCEVRFLEAMPVGPLARAVDRHLIPAAEILERLSARFVLRPVPRPEGQPSTDYAATGQGVAGVIGVIASTTRPFCDTCRRIRVSARGDLLTCLFDSAGSSLWRVWDGTALDEERADAILQAAVLAKPAVGSQQQTTPMISIGG